MTDQFPPPQDPQSPQPPYAPPAPPAEYGQPPAPPYGAPPAQFGQPPVQYGAPIGQVRSTGMCILLAIVTLGIYTYVWWFKTHEEMKRHTGDGLGGVLALVLAFFVGIVMPYLTSSEVGKMQERAGRPKTVSGATGLWYFPGIFLFFIGPIVWFVKTNGAINDYWRSLGAQG